MVNFLLNLLIILIAIAVGGTILLAGRRFMWLLFGVAGLLVAATFIAELQGLPNAYALLQNRDWTALLIALAVGGVGVLISLYLQHSHRIAPFVGFIAGLLIAGWFDEIIYYLADRPPETGFTWWMALIFLAAGVLGLLLARRSPEETLIFVSVIVGAYLISQTLNLNPSSSFAAVITLGLALLGVVVQYASFLREQPRSARPLPPVPPPVTEELPPY